MNYMACYHIHIQIEWESVSDPPARDRQLSTDKVNHGSRCPEANLSCISSLFDSISFTKHQLGLVAEFFFYLFSFAFLLRPYVLYAQKLDF